MPGPIGQMFEQKLEPLKGWHADLNALDKSAKLAASILATTVDVPAGRVVHINDDNEFELGGSGNQMPLYLWQNRYKPDVANDGTSPITGFRHWVGIGPDGTMHGLVATGGFEVQSTEFDKDQTYANNDLLTANADGLLTNEGSVLSKVVPLLDWVCGVCSPFENKDNQSEGLGIYPASVGPRGVNAQGVEMLTFWTYFLPSMDENARSYLS